MATVTAPPDHVIDGTPFFVRKQGSRYQVFERGTGPLGTARLRATCRTRPKAIELAAFLAPSSPLDILTARDDRDRKLLARLTTLGQPGTPLFVLTDDGGYEAVSDGLAIAPFEAMFGNREDLIGCWLVSWRDPDGERGQDQEGGARWPMS